MIKPNIGIDVINKFYSTITCIGLINTSEELTKVDLISSSISYSYFFNHGPSYLGPGFTEFKIQAISSIQDIPMDIKLLIVTTNNVYSYTLEEIIQSTPKKAKNLTQDFYEIINDMGVCNILDMGGRARSGLLRSKEIINHNVTVLDIMNDDGVDVVCDAHIMADVLPNNFYDGIISVSVFEHLIMPWQVAIQMNRVLKVGGIALIHTHQTIGMHDIPWDYYRFSSDAWKGLFNRFTGFEIINVQLEDLMFISPFIHSDRYIKYESSAGFESSSCMVRKVSDTHLNWSLSASDVTDDFYPNVPDAGIMNKNA